MIFLWWNAPGGGEEQHRRVLLRRGGSDERVLRRGRSNGQAHLPVDVEGHSSPE